MDTVETETQKPPTDEPRPWLTPEDRLGWRTVARGRGVGASPPLITVEVRLDAEQSAWVNEAAKRAGVDYEEYIKQLLDHVRRAASPPSSEGSRRMANAIRLAP